MGQGLENDLRSMRLTSSTSASLIGSIFNWTVGSA
jgi:hypothetical protein